MKIFCNRGVLLEAMVMLILASLAIRLFPFRTVMRSAAWPLLRPPPDATLRPMICRRVRWAVLACARRLPWQALCFPQGLAAQWMLRRRGIATILHYGAAPDAKRGLLAHVWVCDGDIAVIGGEAAAGLAVLARFPPDEITQRG